jgi:hypothetical protein
MSFQVKVTNSFTFAVNNLPVNDTYFKDPSIFYFGKPTPTETDPLDVAYLALGEEIVAISLLFKDKETASAYFDLLCSNPAWKVTIPEDGVLTGKNFLWLDLN